MKKQFKELELLAGVKFEIAPSIEVNFVRDEEEAYSSAQAKLSFGIKNSAYDLTNTYNVYYDIMVTDCGQKVTNFSFDDIQAFSLDFIDAVKSLVAASAAQSFK